MEPDTYLSKATRRLSSIRGAWRAMEPLRRFYAAKYAESENPWTTISDVDGDLKFRVDRSSYIGSLLFWRGYHSLKERLLLDKLLTPQMVFVDVGANQGELTLCAAKRLHAGTVLSFEPIETNYRCLLENISLNGFQNVAAYNFGLWHEPGCMEMYTSTDRAYREEWATMFRSGYRSAEVGVVRVEAFDEVFSETGLERLDVMKIDVEGAELPVLRGACGTLKRYRPTILMEVSKVTYEAAGYTTRDVVDFLGRLDYEIFLIKPRGEVAPIGNSELPKFGNILCKFGG
jgi:FkbM family methyltransferase